MLKKKGVHIAEVLANLRRLCTKNLIAIAQRIRPIVDALIMQVAFHWNGVNHVFSKIEMNQPTASCKVSLKHVDVFTINGDHQDIHCGNHHGFRLSKPHALTPLRIGFRSK